MARSPYLVLRGSTYHFRIRVPLAWTSLVGRTQFYRSLRTGSVALARRRAAHLLSLTDALWGALDAEMTPAQAKVLVDQWLTAKLEEDADNRDLPRTPVHARVMFRRTQAWLPDEVVETLDEKSFETRFLQRVGDPTALPKGVSFGQKLSPRDIAKRATAKLTHDAEARRRDDDDLVAAPTFKAWLQAQGVEADESDPQFRAGIRFMLKALADLGRASTVRDEAPWYRWSGPDPAADLYPGAAAPAAPAPVTPTPTATPPHAVPRAPQPAPIQPAHAPTPPDAERERWIATAEEARREIARTEQQRNMRKYEYAAAVELFSAWLDRDPWVDEITPRLVGRYKTDLTYYPKNAAQRLPYRDLPIKERFAAARVEDERRLLEPTTINSKYLSPLRRIFEWLKAAGRGPDANPFAEIRAHRPKRADRMAKRRDFTDGEAATLLALPLFTGSKGARLKPLYAPGRVRVSDWRFWVPLISLYSGMRLNEACALAVADIKEQGGLPFMHVRDLLEGQHTKSEAAWRKVPIHHALLEAGFMDFVGKARASGHPQLFSDLQVNEDGYVSDVPQKFFVHIIARAANPDVDEPGKLTFHSTRHTVVTKLRNLNCREDISTEIVGHEKEGVHAGYGSVALKTTTEWVNQIAYEGVNLDALRQPYSTWRG